MQSYSNDYSISSLVYEYKKSLISPSMTIPNINERDELQA